MNFFYAIFNAYNKNKEFKNLSQTNAKYKLEIHICYTYIYLLTNF